MAHVWACRGNMINCSVCQRRFQMSIPQGTLCSWPRNILHWSTCVGCSCVPDDLNRCRRRMLACLVLPCNRHSYLLLCANMYRNDSFSFVAGQQKFWNKIVSLDSKILVERLKSNLFCCSSLKFIFISNSLHWTVMGSLYILKHG